MINISNQMIISLYSHCILVLAASGVIKRIPHCYLDSLYERNSSPQIPLWLLSCAVYVTGSRPLGAAVLESTKLCFASCKVQLRKP